MFRPVNDMVAHWSVDTGIRKKIRRLRNSDFLSDAWALINSEFADFFKLTQCTSFKWIRPETNQVEFAILVL